MNYLLNPGGALRGEARVPGDKSISHRAVMLGAIADGITRVAGFLEGEDALATVAAFRKMGVEIEGPQDGELVIHGVGLHGLTPPDGELNMGNSGTAMRLLAGVLAGQPFYEFEAQRSGEAQHSGDAASVRGAASLSGDASLSRRPMNRIIHPLRAMGAKIDSGAGGKPPLRIQSSAVPLKGMHHDLPIASAQVKSCLLLAGLYAGGNTRITEPAPTRDHTERMLRSFGYPLIRYGLDVFISGRFVYELPGARLSATALQVPGDISSAAFFLVGASIAPDSDVILRGVGINPTRTGAIDILRGMGADIEITNAVQAGAEPVADIRVRHAPLQGIEIAAADIPRAIDEFPALFIAAACAEGRTVLRGAAELRVKESDRIAAMAEGLATLGAETEVLEDGIIINGFGGRGAFKGGTVDSRHDHRIAMAFAIAALRADAPITIAGAETVATSFPGFAELAAELGLGIREAK